MGKIGVHLLIIYLATLIARHNGENQQHATHPPYLIPAVYSGLTNQKLTFYIAAMYCIEKNLTLVLPNWKMGYNDYADGITVPFKYFFNINMNKLNRIPELKNKFHYVTKFPMRYLNPCLTQLQCSSFDECRSPSLKLIDTWINNYGIACPNSDISFYGIGNHISSKTNIKNFAFFSSLPIVHALRSIMEIDSKFTSIQSQIESNMMLKYNSNSYYCIHARIEKDFFDACKIWKRSGFLNDPAPRACYETDQVMYSNLINSHYSSITLQKIHNKNINNSLVLIINGEVDDINFKSLPKLCAKQCPTECFTTNNFSSCILFTCIRKEFFWSPKTDHSTNGSFISNPNSMAMVDYLLAMNSIAFYGNTYSTFAMEIYFALKTENKLAFMYNRYQSEVK
eukprot:gene4152-5913_t